MFLASGNDAVHALCAHDQGGIPATIQRMNQKAAEIGALDTHVTDPTGLDADGQYSSAYDLALFAQNGLGRPDFAKYASTKYTAFPNAGKGKGTYQVANQNKLLFSYDGALGVKTGYTTLARNTFVGAARRNGHTLVVTMMNAPHGITEDASNLLTWTFDNYGKLSPGRQPGQARGEAQVRTPARRRQEDRVLRYDAPAAQPHSPEPRPGRAVPGLPRPRLGVRRPARTAPGSLPPPPTHPAPAPSLRPNAEASERPCRPARPERTR